MIDKILAINPGSTSTKFAVYEGEKCLINKTIRHSSEILNHYKNVVDQFDFRKDLITSALAEEHISIEDIKYFIGRGGLTKPLISGVYRVGDKMIEDINSTQYGEHASNLGAILANYFANQVSGGLAMIADPVVTDEIEEVARITGHPKFERLSIFHALNQKAAARFHAKSIQKKYEELNLVVAHLGGGISVGAHKKGRVVDVNNALSGEGGFSPERSGSLPVFQLIDVCFSGEYSKEEIKKMVVGKGGYVAYLETNDAMKVENQAKAGDKKSQLIQEALFYQLAKMIGEYAVVLNGQVDAIILTGGLSYNQDLVQYIKDKTSFIAPIHVYPGEDELDALAMNALRVARGETELKNY